MSAVVATGGARRLQQSRQRVDRPRRPRPVDLDPARRESLLAGERELDHREAIRGRRHRHADLVRRVGPPERRAPRRARARAGRPGRPRRDRRGSGRTSRRGRRPRGRADAARAALVRASLAHRSSHGWASHSSSVAPIRTRSPGSIPARRSSSSMPSRARSRWNRSADSSISKFVWAAIRSIRLPRTRNAPSSRSTTNVVRSRARSGGRRRRPAPAARPARRRRAAARRAAPAGRRCPRPSPRTGRRPAGRRRGRLARKSGHAACAAGRSILLNDDEQRLLEQRRVVRLELVADDLAVPAPGRATSRRRRGRGSASARRGGGTRGRDRRRCWRPR